MHAACLLCQILLHWELLPFLPVHFSRPQGPFEANIGEIRLHDAPAGFWTSSAQECFTAARTILHLSSACKMVGSLPSSPFMAYAVYTATFMDLYSQSFPWMCSHVPNLLHDPTNVEEDPSSRFDLAVKLAETSEKSGFEGMQSTVRLVGKWKDNLKAIAEYFDRFKLDFRTALSESDTSFGTQADYALRFGGPGTGASEYSLFEGDLRDFGSLVVDDI